MCGLLIKIKDLCEKLNIILSTKLEVYAALVLYLVFQWRFYLLPAFIRNPSLVYCTNTGGKDILLSWCFY